MTVSNGIWVFGRFSVGWNIHWARPHLTIAIPLAVSVDQHRVYVFVGPFTFIWIRATAAERFIAEVEEMSDIELSAELRRQGIDPAQAAEAVKRAIDEALAEAGPETGADLDSGQISRQR